MRTVACTVQLSDDVGWCVQGDEAFGAGAEAEVTEAISLVDQAKATHSIDPQLKLTQDVVVRRWQNLSLNAAFRTWRGRIAVGVVVPRGIS